MLSVANKLFMLNVIVLSVVILSVVMLSVVMLNVIMLTVVMLSVIMLSVVMVNVVAPFLLYVNQVYKYGRFGNRLNLFSNKTKQNVLSFFNPFFKDNPTKHVRCDIERN